MITLLVLAKPEDPELKLLSELPDDVRIVAGALPEAFDAAAPEADAVLAWWADRSLLEQVLARAPRLRWIHSSAAGVEGILSPTLLEHPAVLTNARGAYSSSLGEFTLASLLFFAKDLRRMMRNQAAGLWEPFDVKVLAGATLGIVGYGDIGRAIAALAKPFRMRVLALRRRPELSKDDPLVDEAFGRGALAEMLGRCDYVAVAAPLTPGTRGLIGAGELAAMKREAVLVNVGRGAVVDEPALVEALRNGGIRGAALDVFETEPLPAGHPFWGMENVLLSPHCADHHEGWRTNAMRQFLENFERFRTRRELMNVVDKREGY